MRYGVVETTKEYVFERQPALFGAFIVVFVSLPAEIVAFEHVHHVLYAESPFCGHHACPSRRYGMVQ